MIATAVKTGAERLLLAKTGEKVIIRSTEPVGGGCINSCYKIISTHGTYFLKYNDRKRYPNMFAAEANGLTHLAKANAIKVPDVIGCGEEGDYTFLLMEFIEKGAFTKDFFYQFGVGLAKLHRTSNDAFGFKENNYIGSLVQSNSWTKNGIDFFIEQRLAPQLAKAYDKGYFAKEILKHFDRLFIKLPEIIPAERPALLHGDLWNGNYLITAQGQACLVDPAVYFGFREQDIAMTRLFGGFDDDLYVGYESEFALEKGWPERIDIFNLYPLLVHVNLFGEGYAMQVFGIIKKF